MSHRNQHIYFSYLQRTDKIGILRSSLPASFRKYKALDTHHTSGAFKRLPLAFAPVSACPLNHYHELMDTFSSLAFLPLLPERIPVVVPRRYEVLRPLYEAAGIEWSDILSYADVSDGFQQAVTGQGTLLEALEAPDPRQRVRHRIDIGVRIEMLLEPAQRELHAPTPPESVGTSSAEKP